MNRAVRLALDRVLAAKGEERTAILNTLSPGVRSEVLDLLRFDDHAAEEQIEAVVANAARELLAAQRAELPSPGTVFGRYRILRLIGEGSMGAVFEAEQDKPRRRVALKLIKPGLACAGILRRFEQEAEALGRLQHPAIARIYEAGTVGAGQPYFAMEFIQGQPLSEYAASQSLDAASLMELVARICDGVQHAHQRGLIHRDLKPGNILIEATGQPRILDFGVARVTDSDVLATRKTDAGQVIGTLAYMSPEQVLADPFDLDTRSDVYALGVILYELLAGTLPYQLGSKLHEAARAICEQEPVRLGSLDRRFRGDVETIVAKALEKDKARRYASAAELASDLRRHLTHQPIAARPPSTAYQLQKFALRNKPLVLGVTAAFLALTAGAGVSSWQAVRAHRASRAAIAERDRATTAERIARQERDRANLERQRAVEAEGRMIQERNHALAEQKRADTQAAAAKAISEFLENDLLLQAGMSWQSGPATRPDPDLKVRTALDRAAARIVGKFPTQPLVEASLRQTIGNAYRDLGLYPEAQRELERALEIQRRVFGQKHADTLASQSDLTVLYLRQGRYELAEQILTRTLQLQRRTLGRHHRNTMETAFNLAMAYRSQAKYARAEELFAEVLQYDIRVRGKEHPHTLMTMYNLAELYRYQGRYAESEPLSREALAIQRRILGNQHPQTLNSISGLAATYRALGRYPEAEPLYIEAVEVRRQTLGEEHPATLTSMNNLAVLYLTQGKFREAESIESRVVEASRRVLGERHPDALTYTHNLGTIHLRLGNLDQAEALYTKALQLRRQTLGNAHPRTLTSQSGLAAVYRARADNAEAERLLLETMEAQTRVVGGEHPDTLSTQGELAALYQAKGRLAEAESLLTKTLEKRRLRHGPGHAETLDTVLALAEVRIKRGSFADAEPLLSEAIRGFDRFLPEGWRRYYARVLLGICLAHRGRYPEAEPLLVSGQQGLEVYAATIPWENRAVRPLAGEVLARIQDSRKKFEREAVSGRRP
jgi:tetratricopeptide (TPR) repeat protein